MRVLFISYYFPPAAGGGVQRVLKFAKYLPQFDVDVHVLTVDDPHWVDADGGLVVPDATLVHRTGYRGPRPGKPKDILAGKRGLRRITAWLRLQPRRLYVPDMHAPWIKTATKAGIDVVRECDIDIIISTSPPETDHVIGHNIAQQTGVPWIADFRDSWLDEPGLRLDKLSVRIKRKLNTRISNRIIPKATAVLTVSDPISSEMRTRYPILAAQDRIHTLMNAVDLDDFADLSNPDKEGPQVTTNGKPKTEKFTILYTGNFFGKRTPRPFLEALQQLLEKRSDLRNRIQMRFIGSLKIGAADWINSQPLLSPVVTVESFMEYRKTLAAQKAADLLLLVIATDPRNEGEVTGKLFEYVAARRPLLAAVPPAGAAARFLKDVAGAVVCDPNDRELMTSTLETHVDNWLNHGTHSLPMSPELEHRISRAGRASELADLLHEMVGSKAD